jgi:signal transduction histidine kinase
MSTVSEFPRRLTDNPQKWEEYVRSFDASMIATAIAGTVVMTLAAEIATWLLRGHAAADGRFGIIFPWVLVLGIAGTALVAQWQMRRQNKRRIPVVCWAFGTLQMLWMIGLAWYSVPEFSVVLAAALWAVAFHDARYFYDAIWLRLHYLLVWPAFFLILFAVDLFGGPGLLARAREQPGFVRMALAFSLLVAGLVQIILVVIGRQWYRLDVKVWAHASAQTQLAEMRREREVIARSCAFIAQGLTAGQFSHDVASPLSTVSLSVGQLVENLDALAAELEARRDKEILSRVVTLREAVTGIARGNARLHEMTSAMSRSLRGGSTLAEVDIGALMSAAEKEMRVSSGRHGVRPAQPIVEVTPGTVFATEEHAAALGSILCNGVLQKPEVPLHVRGTPLGRFFYLLAIRDQGVPSHERAAALERVRASLALVDAGAKTESTSTYQGYGIGLTLAKLLLVRNNGWLAVDAPAEGPGLIFKVVLPRISPSDIPVGDNTPEKLAEDVSRNGGGPTRERSGLTVGEDAMSAAGEGQNPPPSVAPLSEGERRN